MKILKKNEIHAEGEKQKREKIDEGLMLSSGIEKLRVTKLELEQQHQKFIDGMKDSLEKEIAPLRKEKEDLLFDVSRAREEAKLLRAPLDEEWKIVLKEVKKNTDKQQALNVREQNLIDSENELSESGLELEKAWHEVEELKDIAIQDSKEASDDKKEAKELLGKIAKDLADTISHGESETLKIEHRVKELDMREVDLDSKEYSLQQKEKELNDRERYINDKYATLLRTEERLKK